MNAFVRGFPCRLPTVWFLVIAGLLPWRGAVAQPFPLPPESAITILAPASGARYVIPGPVVFEAQAVDPLGDIRHLEFFANGDSIGKSDYLLKIATIPGRPIPHRLEWKVTKAGVYRVVARGKDTLGKEVTSKPVEIQVGENPATDGWMLVRAGSVWRYSNDGANPSSNWMGLEFDDSKWPSGPAPLGYGDGDEKTVTRTGGGTHPISAYFRQRFPFPADLGVSRLRLRLVRDDGAAVYLNGKELVRDNLPSGVLRPQTLAKDSVDGEGESAFQTFTVEAGALVAGDNVLAVEVHQSSASSSDLSFDLEATAVVTPVRPPAVVSIEATRDQTSEPRPEARIAPGEFTLRRTGSTAGALDVLVLYSGSATPGLDYEKLPNVVTIPDGKSETQLYVGAADDDLLEGEETVVAEIVLPPVEGGIPSFPGYTIDGSRSRAKVVIFDADRLPEVGIVATRDATSEPRPEARIANGELTVRRTSPIDKPLDVHLRFGGTAIMGLDYAKIASPVTIPAGSYTTTVDVNALDDEFFEGDETVVVEVVSAPIVIDPLASVGLPPPPQYTIDSANREAKVLIRDADEKPQPWLLNINFGLWTKKTGLAATGDGPDDFWNPWESTGQPDVTSGGLMLATGASAAGVELRVQNAGGNWNNQTGDGMYDSYIYPNSGRGDGVGNISVSLSGIPEGEYELYLYGHSEPGGRPESDSVFTVLTGDQKLGPLGTRASAGWTVEQGWQAGAQYVVFHGLRVGGTKLLDIEVMPGFDGTVVPDRPLERVAILNGLQLRRTSGGPNAASITLTEPAPGSRFSQGSIIPVSAVAVDPKGYISRVEFFSDDTSIGVSEINFIRAPDPGTPIHHQIEWVGAKPGEHRLVVRARDSAGKPVESGMVPIVVGNEPPTVVLEVEASDDSASEPLGAGQPDAGAFVIRRVGGPKDVLVPVYYSLGGTAQNGEDYEKLSGQVTLPAGAESVRVPILPIGDKAKEGDEKVLLELESPICPAIFPVPPQCYRIGEKGSAVVVIRDAGTSGNHPPVVNLVSPKTGTSYLQGEVILIAAEALDADGRIERLDIRSGDRLLGSSKDGKLVVEWKDAEPGAQKLWARAVDNAGAESVSTPVLVVVRAVEDIAFVHRDLPPAYLPGAVVDVTLVAEPPRSGTAWTVEEVPPAGWAASSISDEGSFDAVTGKVKFGPYTDTAARRLTYRVSAPNGATGAQKFSGRSSLDGSSFPVAGDEVLQPAGALHPADVKPADNAISADELTGYAAAWKLGKPWGSDAGRIPVTHVARAGQIWKSGEAYHFDGAAGAPPTCWVPGAARPALAGAVRRATESDEPAASGSAARVAAAVHKPGTGGRVELLIRPPAGTLAVAVEETVPAGWSVSSISDEGVFDAESRKIRWGLFFGASPRQLSYTVTPPAGVASTATWLGVVSFDGLEIPIAGVGRSGASDESTASRIRGSRREGHGKVRFQLEAPADQVLAIEVSSDLKTWTEIGATVNTGEDVVVTDDGGDAAPQRYYRLRPVGR